VGRDALYTELTLAEGGDVESGILVAVSRAASCTIS
jgi:hypothetical protein